MEPDSPSQASPSADAEPSPAAARLAAALAARLNAVLPKPFRAEADGGSVALYRDGTWDGSTDVAGVFDQALDPADQDDPAWSFAGRARMVAWNVLSSAQDAVAEATTEPWPVLPDGRMALPGSRADGGRVHLWYGPDYESEAGAVLTLAPIPLAGLEQAG